MRKSLFEATRRWRSFIIIAASIPAFFLWAVMPAGAADTAALLTAFAQKGESETSERALTVRNLGEPGAEAATKWIKGDAPIDQKMRVMKLIGLMGMTALSARPTLGEFAESASEPLKSEAIKTLQTLDLYERCGLSELPANAKLFTLGANQGEGRLDFQIGDTKDPVGQIDVVVTETGRPIVLALSAYKPVLWRVGALDGVQIAGVLVYGYQPQALIGIGRDVPHRILIPGKESHDCPIPAVREGSLTGKDEADLRALTGLSPEATLRLGLGGRVFAGPELQRGSTAVHYSDDIPLDRYVTATNLKPGKSGVEQLLSQGRVRRPTEAELLELRATIAAQDSKRAELVPTAADGLYVIIRDLTFPPGLIGPDKQTFLVPKGVPRPKGDPGESIVFRLDEFIRQPDTTPKPMTVVALPPRWPPSYWDGRYYYPGSRRGPPPPAANFRFRAGMNCDVLRGSSWWAGIIEDEMSGRYRVHFPNWERQWDEWVGAWRIRCPGRIPMYPNREGYLIVPEFLFR